MGKGALTAGKGRGTSIGNLENRGLLCDFLGLASLIFLTIIRKIKYLAFYQQ